MCTVPGPFDAQSSKLHGKDTRGWGRTVRKILGSLRQALHPRPAGAGCRTQRLLWAHEHWVTQVGAGWTMAPKGKEFFLAMEDEA